MQVQPKGIVLKAVRTHCTDADWLGRGRCAQCDIHTTVVQHLVEPERTDGALKPIENVLYSNHGQLYREGEEGNPKMMSLGLHLRIIGRPGRIWALEEFFRHVRQHDGVWVTTRKAIADHFAQTVPA